MKRQQDENVPQNRRKSIKLIDFTTPDKEDIEQTPPPNIQQPDLLLFSVHKPSTAATHQSPINHHSHLHKQLQSTQQELNTLKTLYEEQQLIVNTYRKKEQSTTELINNMKNDVVILEDTVSDLQLELKHTTESNAKDMAMLQINHQQHIKSMTDVQTLLNNEVDRLNKQYNATELQLKEATLICNELLLYFNQQKQVQDNKDDLLS